MPLTKRQDQAVIRSLIQNWNWETENTPKWLNSLLVIAIRIDDHNKQFRNDNLPELSFNIRQRLIEIHELIKND